MSSVLLRSLASSASGHHAVASAAAAAASRQSAAAVILTTKSGRLLTVSPSNRFFESCRKMSSFLVDEPKYAFLKDLGIEKRNPGVYNGTWGGSGDVSWSHILPLKICLPECLVAGILCSARLRKLSWARCWVSWLSIKPRCRTLSMHLDARILNGWQKI